MVTRIKGWGPTLGLITAFMLGYVTLVLVVQLTLNQPVAATCIANIGLIAGVAWWRHRDPPQAVPIPVVRRNQLAASGGIALITAWLCGQGIAQWVYRLPGNQSGFDASNQALHSAPVWQMVVLALVLAPLAEEGLLRALVFERLEGLTGMLPAALISAIVFGLIHGNVVALSYTVPLGFVLALIYARQRSWLDSTLAHASFNALSLIGIYPIKNVNAETAITLALVLITTCVFFFITTKSELREAGVG